MDWSDKGLEAVLELYSPYDESSLQLAGINVPLETDTTAPLAYALNDDLSAANISELLPPSVQALLAAGDRSGAEAVGSRWLARQPNGPHSRRIRELLGLHNP